MAPFTDAQLKALETTERIASCFSLVGTTFVFLTFISSPNFRRPINRLVFYASWGNTLSNIATLISESGIKAGQASHLCQFQAFLIQMFVPADAFWNLAMAFNVYLTLFRKYNAHQLKALEWKYHILCYGIPFVIAFSLLFVETNERKKIYGDALLWCWISHKWDFLRLALCYGPAWVCIVAAFSIYIASGAEIFKKRKELRDFSNGIHEDSWLNYKTTQIAVTSELNHKLGTVKECFEQSTDPTTLKENRRPSSPFKKPVAQYSVSIASPPAGGRPSLPPSMMSSQGRKNRQAMEANRAAWGYTKVALLFFVSLLVTWVPSSANRVYAFSHPGSSNVGLAFAAGLVLSLMGFWNSVIYVVTSRTACKELITKIFSRGSKSDGDIYSDKDSLSTRRPTQRDSWADDYERLADMQQTV